MALYGKAYEMIEAPQSNLHEATGRAGDRTRKWWAMTVAFVVWAALWAFAPLQIAKIGSIGAVVASVVVMLGYAMWRYAACRASKSA